ncbi:MAG: hypothetical protein AAB116_19940 [Candidatus Poribacteria bacterium]
MKRFTALFCAFVVIALSALPINSFADHPHVFSNQGDIAGLNFYFGKPGLPVDLSAIGIDPFKAVSVDIQTSGHEITIIYPDTKDYFYDGRYRSGTIFAQTVNKRVIEIPMVSATLVENFIIEGPIEDALANPFAVKAPATTSLTFRAVLGSDSNTVRFALVVQNGGVVFAGTY